MPIIGLTDKTPELPRIGILRKGGKKVRENAPGPDLDYFRFVADDDAAADAFLSAYGPQPREVNVFLPFPTVKGNWEAWKEDWKASALQHRCDGVTCVLWLTPRGTYSTEPRPCPGNCKQVGRLKVVIPELARYAIVTVLTTGKWDVMNLDASLKALDQIKSSPTLQGIPLVVRRVEREISTPRPDGKRARAKKWLLQIEAAPRWVALQLQAAERQALPAGPQLALNAAPDVIESDDDDDAEIGTVEPVANGTPRVAVPGSYEMAAVPTGGVGVDAALLAYCNKQKGDKNGPAFFKAQYGAKSEEQKLAIARSLGLIPDATAEIVAPYEEAVENGEDFIEEIEALFAELKAAGKSGADMTAAVARLAKGEIGLDEMDADTLRIVRDGLMAWLGEAKTKGAAK